MNNTVTSSQRDDLLPRQSKARERVQKNSRRTLWLAILSVAVWCGLMYGGYALLIHNLHTQQSEFESRLQGQIEETRLENSEKLEQLNAELTELALNMEDVSENLESIREALQLTSESISGSDDTKLALQEQISRLDKQLQELKQSLEKLENAARVY